MSWLVWFGQNVILKWHIWALIIKKQYLCVHVVVVMSTAHLWMQRGDEGFTLITSISFVPADLRKPRAWWRRGMCTCSEADGKADHCDDDHGETAVPEVGEGVQTLHARQRPANTHITAAWQSPTMDSFPTVNHDYLYNTWSILIQWIRVILSGYTLT